MTLIQNLLSESKQGKKELSRQELIVSVTEQIWAALEEAGMSKADLARALESSKANVTQLLNGQRNMTLSSLADIAAAIGVKPCIYLTKYDSLAATQGHVMRTMHGVHVVGPRQVVSSESAAKEYHFVETPKFEKRVAAVM